MSNGVIGEVIDRKDRPAYVRFERRVVEDRESTKREGRFIGKDVDFALVTPPYSIDVFEQKVTDWIANMEREVVQGRLPQAWLDKYKESYDKWLKGQEMPLDGVPIRGWGVCSPAQQENLIRLNILTVEDLAYANDEAIRRIGMGAVELRQKAKAWLMNMANHGQVTIEMAALKVENTNLKTEIETLKRQVSDLIEQGKVNTLSAMVPAQVTDSILPADQIGKLAPVAAPEPKTTPAAARVAAKIAQQSTSENAKKIMAMETK